MRRRRSADLPRLSLEEAGFTVTELLVAAALLSVVLLAVISTLMTGYQDITYGGNLTRAAVYAQQKMEELRNSSTFPPAPVSPAPPMTDAPSPGWTRSWVVSSVTGASPSRIATLVVTVTWSEPTGAKSVRVATYRVEP